jgi:putative endonuclease
VADMTVGRSTSPTHQVGQKAEEAALLFLQQQGFHLVEQNFHCRMGEIDLIMTKAQLLIFVEVRQRKSSVYGTAAASVTVSKQRKIIKTSAYFLQLFPKFENYDCRFDVIAIDHSNINAIENSQKIDLGNKIINWIEGAFDAEMFYR